MNGGGDQAEQLELLHLVERCAGEIRVAQLARRVGEALVRIVPVDLSGLAVFDEERSTVERYSLFRRGPAPDSRCEDDAPPLHQEELEAGVTEFPLLLSSPDASVRCDLEGEPGAPLLDRLRDEGLSCYLSVAIRVEDKMLGALFVGSGVQGVIDAGTTGLVKRLARLLAPALYNCLNHARFARGDRRRDALIELSRVINSSLDLDTVLLHARHIAGGLEGHRLSSMDLLNENHETYVSYRTETRDRGQAVALLESTVHRVRGSAMGWILEHGSTYESDDLEKSCRFDDELELLAKGVRRYVAIPLLARGRILGGFKFGTDDPRPRRKVEYWFYENIALQLGLAIDNAMKHQQLQRHSSVLAHQNACLRTEIQASQGFGVMIGRTPAMDELRAAIARVAPTDATVLITGETGVGKELVARTIHELSGRSEQPFVKVNCPSIPEGMVESELFGHERGAFTSAFERRIGRFELAGDGTLLLDEIGELSLALQAKLLRVLQDGEFERVGGSKTLSTNARIIAATNRDPHRAIEQGRFRSDLYFRLNVFPIHVPPLRERRSDIPLLVSAFMAEFGNRLGKRMERVAEDSLAELCAYSWPGNIRELRHVIERGVILSDDDCLRVDSADMGIASTTSLSLEQPSGRKQTLDAIQAEHILRTLESCGGVIDGKRGAAAVLGMNPSTLRFRMKRLGIDRPGRKVEAG